MTYAALDKQRFSYLLNLGTDDYELRRFFTECRIQLIQRGAKVQNLPHGDKARVRTLVHDLGASTDEIVRKWFALHISMSDPEAPAQIIELFKLHEEVGEKLEEPIARRLARSCLVHIFSDEPDSLLLQFLRTPIGGAEERREDTQPEPLHDSAIDLDSCARAFIALMQGRDVDEFLDDLPQDLAGLVAGLHAAIKGDAKQARALLEGLPDGSYARARLDQFLTQQAARPLKAAPRGISLLPYEDFSGSFDYDTDEIIGYCTNASSPKAVFVQPVAVIRGGVASRLSHKARRESFPINGDVMAFAGSGYPKQPSRGEVGAWHVEAHETEKATRFHLKSEARQIFEVFKVPFPSTDYDSVREFIREFWEMRGAHGLQKPLFALGDGLIVSPRADKTDLSRDEAFEGGLLSWNELHVVGLEGRIFFLGPLPREHGIYECASLASSIKKLLRPFMRTGSAAAGLTKAQLHQVVSLVGSHEAEVTAARLQRVRSAITQISENEEALEALAAELVQHNLIKQRIDALVEDIAHRQAAEKKEIQEELTQLSRERDDWRERIRKEKDAHKKLRDDTSNVVKAAFAKARKEGVATLAELAIFQELAGAAGKTEGVQSFRPQLRDFDASEIDIAALLRKYGVGARNASGLVAFSALARNSGAIVCIRGIASRLVVEPWAQALGSGIAVDVSVGLTDDVVPVDLTRPSMVVLLNANLAPVELYARSVLDGVIRVAGAGVDADSTLGVFLTLSDSVAHLPLSAQIERVALHIDLDRTYQPQNSDFEATVNRVFDLQEGSLTAKMWRPLCDKLRKRFEALDADTQQLILPILTAQ